MMSKLNPLTMLVALLLTMNLTAAEVDGQEVNKQEVDKQAVDKQEVDKQAVDQQSGLIKDSGWELVRGHCGACHSLKLVTSNRADRQTWLETIRWMQETQNLWQFEPAVEDKILTYLAKNYPPREIVRRKPIPAALMPK